MTETTDEVKLRAAQRAIDGVAPFHRNGMNDALLIETYAALKAAEPSDAFAFVTHNLKDFSHNGTDNRLPHPDLAHYFAGDGSAYYIDLGDALREIDEEAFEEVRFESEWAEEPRTLAEILEVENLLTNRVWYNRHWNTRIQLEGGEIELVDKVKPPYKDIPHDRWPVQRDVWEGALASAARVEAEYGLEGLGPWSDFKWGMINGKLSALRWILGSEWDDLYA